MVVQSVGWIGCDADVVSSEVEPDLFAREQTGKFDEICDAGLLREGLQSGNLAAKADEHELCVVAAALGDKIFDGFDEQAHTVLNFHFPDIDHQVPLSPF